MNFKEYMRLTEQNVPGAFDGPYVNGAFVTAVNSVANNMNFRAADTKLGKISQTNLEIPQVTKQGYIEIFRRDRPNIDGLQSPTYIQLSDGTKMWMTTQELNRIKGTKPERGRYMIVTMQRHPEDQTGQQSKINNIMCY